MNDLKSSYMKESLGSIRTVPQNGSYESVVNYHLRDRSTLICRTTHSMQNGIEVGTTRSLEAVKDGKTFMKSEFAMNKETNVWKPITPAESKAANAKDVLQPRPAPSSVRPKGPDQDVGGPEM